MIYGGPGKTGRRLGGGWSRHHHLHDSEFPAVQPTARDLPQGTPLRIPVPDFQSAAGISADVQTVLTSIRHALFQEGTGCKVEE